MSDENAGGLETVLRLTGITKRFGDLVANDEISLELARGQIMGLLGENGAGKTTLMNILFGHYVADEGSIEVFGKTLPPGEPKAALRAGIGMVHQHFTLAENLSVLDNIVLGTRSLWGLRTGRRAARKRIAALAEDFGLQIDANAIVATLSVGERQRVEILKALYRDARILILDEPTAVLTPQESVALFATLKKFVAKGLSIIFISHKLGEILAACDTVAVLRNGELVAEGSTEGVTREELAELMVGRVIVKPKATEAQLRRPILELRKIHARQGAVTLKDLDLIVFGGEIVGVAGVAGNGQSLLADVIAGVVRPHAGQIAIAESPIASTHPRDMVRHGVARIPEDRHAEGLIGEMSVMENAISERLRDKTFSRGGMVRWSKARAFANDIITKYDVKCSGPSARAQLLSGGNMQKLILGRVLAGNPKVILANQPTRGLDVGAVAYVHEQLLAARADGAGVLLISEDLEELLALSDSICVMYKGEITSPMGRRDVTVQKLGLMMAGQGHAHAA